MNSPNVTWNRPDVDADEDQPFHVFTIEDITKGAIETSFMYRGYQSRPNFKTYKTLSKELKSDSQPNATTRFVYEVIKLLQDKGRY